MTNVDALKALYVALGGSADAVAVYSTIKDMLNATAVLLGYSGADAKSNADAIANIATVAQAALNPSLQDKTVTPSTSKQTIKCTSAYYGLGTVTVNAVTAAIDNNITAGNIKSGVTILGVEGTYTGE